MSATANQASIAVLINNRKALATYNYLIPEHLKTQIKVGQLVVVPFKSTKRLGFVVQLGSCLNAHEKQLKQLEALVDTHIQLTEAQITLAYQVANYYLEPLSSVLALSLPPAGFTRLKSCAQLNPEHAHELKPEVKELLKKGYTKSYLIKKIGEQQVSLYLKKGVLKITYQISAPVVKPATKEFIKLLKAIKPASLRGEKQQQVVKQLLKTKEKPLKEVLNLTGASRATLKSLIKKGIISLTAKPLVRQPDLTFLAQKKSINLTAEQLNVINKLKPLVGLKHGFHLLEGVTGSGKTDVYIELAGEALRQRKSVLFLVPEVSLINQLAARIKQKFSGQIVVYHSYLSAGERYDAWWQVFNGEKKIVVGTRSALFLPFRQLGLVVVDEEHETSYKQNQTPRYHARTVAYQLAKITNSILILGSATPAIETKYKAEKEGFHFKLTKRPLNQRQPTISLIDLRKVQRFKQSSLSEPLKVAIDETLSQGYKVIIFLNRRGFAPYLICRECGYVPVCRYCAVALTYHRQALLLKCHHCNATYKVIDSCPQCGGLKVYPGGVGTERVEADLKSIYPEVLIVRFDADTVGGKDKHRQLLLNFGQAEKGILLGTQMISKGLDFPDIALVGIINADTALNLPDFRAAERTSQLIYQVAGRSGRGDVPGRVLVQTYNPENYCLQLLNKSYDDFYAQELIWRQKADYPPFTEIINIIVSGPDNQATEKEALRLANDVKAQISFSKSKIIGPAPAPIEYMKGQYRWHFAIFTKEAAQIKPCLAKISPQRGKIKVIIDIDPIWLL